MNCDTLPIGALLTGIQCSTAHITDSDNSLLYHASHQQEEYGQVSGSILPERGT